MKDFEMKKAILGLVFLVLLVSIISVVIAEQNQAGQDDDDETACIQDSECGANKICISGECEDNEDEEQENEEQESNENDINKTRIKFIPAQKRNESECVEGCKCVGAVVSCETETGKIMTITAGSSGKTIIITIEKSENETGICKSVCKEKCEEGECETKCKEKCKNIEVETELELEQEESNNQTKLKAKLSNGKLAEIKIMPDTANERALERLRLKVCSEENNCTIQLKEVGGEASYELQAERHAKILGLFQAKMQVKAQVDAGNGEVKIGKPWWAFLASEPAEE